MLKNVAISQVLERMRFENPWWVSKAIDPYYEQMPRRMYFNQFAGVALQQSVNRSVVLMGPRRVGKTVMLHHLVKQALEKGIAARKILFITVENPIYNNISLEDLFTRGREAAGDKDELNGWYVIFDEIQYLKDWDVHLKVLVDSYRNSRFIVSGSAAAALQLKSKESGAGRFTDFMLPPLTFYEFITMQNLDDGLKRIELPWGDNKVPFYRATDIRQFNKYFIDYMNYGGYPEAIFSEAVRNDPERFIRHDVVDKVLLRDLPGLYGIRDIQELNSLFTTIAYNTAQEFSPEKLSQQSGSQKLTIKRYIEYLEAAFLIKIVRKVDTSGKRFQRDTLFKIYLTNPALRSALFSPIQATDEAIGAMVETAIYAQWMHRQNFTPYYARVDKGEVDMVGLSAKDLKPNWALEIKWSDRPFTRHKELQYLIKFCKQNGLTQALVTTLQAEGVQTIDGIEVTFIPASTYAFTVGERTLEATS